MDTAREIVEMLAGEDAEYYRSVAAATLPLGALLAAFIVCADASADATHARGKPPRPAAAAVDPDGQEAIALVQQWRAAGDERSVAQRLSQAVLNPLYPRAWSAEKSEEDSYLVIFREPAGFPVYAFEVDLEAEEIRPTPEAVERLTMLRVAEEGVRLTNSSKAGPENSTNL